MKIKSHTINLKLRQPLNAFILKVRNLINSNPVVCQTVALIRS